MALREVKPLNTEQWKQVQNMMNNGPTDKSISTVKNALERANKIRRM